MSNPVARGVSFDDKMSELGKVEVQTRERMRALQPQIQYHFLCRAVGAGERRKEVLVSSLTLTLTLAAYLSVREVEAIGFSRRSVDAAELHVVLYQVATHLNRLHDCHEKNHKLRLIGSVVEGKHAFTEQVGSFGAKISECTEDQSQRLLVALGREVQTP